MVPLAPVLGNGVESPQPVNVSRPFSNLISYGKLKTELFLIYFQISSS